MELDELEHADQFSNDRDSIGIHSSVVVVRRFRDSETLSRSTNLIVSRSRVLDQS